MFLKLCNGADRNLKFYKTLHLACSILSTDSRRFIPNSLTDSGLRMKIQRLFIKRTELRDCADFYSLPYSWSMLVIYTGKNIPVEEQSPGTDLFPCSSWTPNQSTDKMSRKQNHGLQTALEWLHISTEGKRWRSYTWFVLKDPWKSELGNHRLGEHLGHMVLTYNM